MSDKNRIYFVSFIAILLLASILLVSVQKRHSALRETARNPTGLALRGTYIGGNGLSMPGAEYLLFDGDGHFCRYTQEDGILDNGEVLREECLNTVSYTLTSDNGNAGCAVRTMEGLYLFDRERNTVEVYTKADTALALLGGLDWPDWLRPPGESAEE